MALLAFAHIKIKYSYLFFRSTRKERQEILHGSLWKYYFLPSIIVEKHYTWNSHHHHHHQTRPKLVQAVWKFCKLHVFVERGGKWNRRQLPNKFRQKEKSPIVNATSNNITQSYIFTPIKQLYYISRYMCAITCFTLHNILFCKDFWSKF